VRAFLRCPAAVSAAGLILGFAVAAATGVRPLGGIVLVLAGLLSFAHWRRMAGTPAAVGLGLVFLALFVLSHVLAKAIGAWPAVLTVAAVMAAASWWQADSRTRRPAAVG
jgi:hypothetical protein